MTTTGRGFWLLVAACAVHVVEEYVLDWRSWVHGASGVQLSWGRFWLMNTGFLTLACLAARIGFTRPTIGLALPSLTLINGVCFHIVPTIVFRQVSPGVFSSVLLYVPLSTWLFWQAKMQGRLTHGVTIGAILLGAAVMALPFVLLTVG